MIVQEIIETVKKSKVEYQRYPHVCLFDEEIKDSFEDTIEELKREGNKIIDINQYVTIKSEDYEMSVSDLGFYDESGKLKAKDLIEPDIKIRKLIVRAKLNRLQDIVNKDTILVVTYNDLFLQNEMFCEDGFNTLYEIIRDWFKDGYRNVEEPLNALVYLETKEKIRDFCMYGMYYNKDGSKLLYLAN